MTCSSINLARFDLITFRLVVCCTRTGSLSTAAALTNSSLSGASHRLKRLEESLGKSLFRRHRWGLEPTETGRLVAQAGEEILRLVETMASAAAGDAR